jgi:hypothetical protein
MKSKIVLALTCLTSSLIACSSAYAACSDTSPDIAVTSVTARRLSDPMTAEVTVAVMNHGRSQTSGAQSIQLFEGSRNVGSHAIAPLASNAGTSYTFTVRVPAGAVSLAGVYVPEPDSVAKLDCNVANNKMTQSLAAAFTTNSPIAQAPVRRVGQ